MRAWGVRAAGNMRRADDRIRTFVWKAATDPAADVRLQAVIAMAKLDPSGDRSVGPLIDVAAQCGDDKLLPHIVWQNLQPLLEDHSGTFLERVARIDLAQSPGLAGMIPYATERILARVDPDPDMIVALVELLTHPDRTDVSSARNCLATLAEKVQTGQIVGRQLARLRVRLEPRVTELLRAGPQSPLQLDAALLAASWKQSAAYDVVRDVFASSAQPDRRRLQALGALVAAGEPSVLELVAPMLADGRRQTLAFRGQMLASLGRMRSPDVARVVLREYEHMEPELKPKAIELLTQRTAWAGELLAAIGRGEIPPTVLNENQVRKLLTTGDQELASRVAATWGTVRSERSPDREAVIVRMRRLLRDGEGDASAGAKVYMKVCGQCHKIYGQGQDVGPDITVNGRNSFEQLLSNVFDPSLVIGAAYQARTVATVDGRVLTGLLVEDGDRHVVLKVQGGKLEAVARGDIDQMITSRLSLMPEKLEEQLKPEELVDLFAFLTLDKPPDDPTARRLPGAGPLVPRRSTDPSEFEVILAHVAPGFTTRQAGEGGLRLLAKHFGRPGVVRTHPVARNRPCVLSRSVDVPQGRPARLLISASHHPRGDWRLIVKADGKVLHDSPIGPQTTIDGWAEIVVDLSPLAGRTIKLELCNQPSGWQNEFAFWGRVEIVTEP